MIADALKRIAQHHLFRDGLFVLVLVVVSFFYNYHEIISYRPTSMHQWRNSVSASMALNYAHEGDFFHPRTHNLQADDLTSDVSVTEFPVIYFLIGMLYRVFGIHEQIFRLVNILIGFTGLFFLFRLGIRTFENTLYAMVPPLLIFSSPIYVYYINNFIPDATSLSIVFIAFFFFYRFYEKQLNRDFFLSLLFFALAGLIKTPALLLYFAVFGLLFLELLFRTKFHDGRKLFYRWPLHLTLLLGVLVLIFTWYAYAKIYTDTHGGIVSEVEIRPIWILSQDTIGTTWVSIKEKFWAGKYHSPVLLIISLLLLIHNLVCWKRYNRLLSWLILLTFIGGIAFSLLFYRSLKNHDYYQMNNLVVPLLIIFNFLLFMKKNYHSVFRSWISRSLMALLILFLIVSCRSLMTNHYYGGWFEWNAKVQYNNRYNDITPYLRSLGLTRYDKVYCTPDPSINISLNLMDQKGFTDFFRGDQTFSEKLGFFSEYGLQYVVVGDTTVMNVAPGDVGLEKIGEYREVRIYKLLD
jgi:4-amino-4-deoxy-L-arabinose transferase-like glycosyltransferase